MSLVDLGPHQWQCLTTSSAVDLFANNAGASDGPRLLLVQKRRIGVIGSKISGRINLVMKGSGAGWACDWHCEWMCLSMEFQMSG